MSFDGFFGRGHSCGTLFAPPGVVILFGMQSIFSVVPTGSDPK